MHIMTERDQTKNASGNLEGSLRRQLNIDTLLFMNFDAKRQGSIFFLCA